MTQAHYYGDTVRTLLVIAGLIMVVTTPFFYDLIPKLSFFSIFAALVLVILGGFVSPRHRGVVIMSTIAAAAAFIVFQYYAISTFGLEDSLNAFFFINEILAIICLAATYYGTKSIRGLKQAEGL